MFAPRLRVVLQLLLATCATSVLGSSACDPPCPDPYGEPEPYPLGIDFEVRGAASDDQGFTYLVGAGGLLFELSGSRRHKIADVDLRAVAVNRELIMAIGAASTLVVGTRNGESWERVELGTTAELRHISTMHWSTVPTTIIVGDGVMFWYDSKHATWVEIAPPEGGWGDLRATGYDSEKHLIAVGRGGVVWTAPAPAGPWTREDAGTDADLLTLSPPQGDLNFIGGASGTLLARSINGAWQPVALDNDTDIIDLSSGHLLTADGRIFAIEDTDGFDPRVAAELGPGPRVLIQAGSSDIIALGSTATFVPYVCLSRTGPCEGRPFVVDAVARTAPVITRADWCAPTTVAPELSEATRAALAATWTAAARDEHASIAAFAVAVLELMSLGAPPGLLVATQAAMADEVEHARLCFAQARRHGGTPLGPGPLVIDGGALARAGDPAAIAVAVLVEGCVGEGAAAAEAAMAAEACEDPEARAVLATLARDEARHAALAWSTLRWLIDRFGETVAIPLRQCLATLAPPALPTGPDPRIHGHLSTRERRLIHRELLASVVRPLATTLLAAPGPEAWAAQ